MSRMTPAEGVERYHSAPPPDYITEYDPAYHDEEMRDMVTGLVGAMRQLKLPVLTAWELGLSLPVAAIDLGAVGIRILVDPDIDRYIKKGQEFFTLTALTYKGDVVILDTYDYIYYDEYNALVEAFKHIKDYLIG